MNKLSPKNSRTWISYMSLKSPQSQVQNGLIIIVLTDSYYGQFYVQQISLIGL